jgi:diguanylate cyclase (GGDEF)-like protein
MGVKPTQGALSSRTAGKPIFIEAMHRLRSPLNRPLHRDGDPYDDGPLPDLTSGLMWIATGLMGAVAQALPGTTQAHLGWVLGLCGFAIAWGAFSVFAGLRGWTMALKLRAVVTALMMPVVGVAIWATGGATSYLLPILLFTGLFIGWFFPPRMAWPLVVLFLVAYGSPLFYDADAIDTTFPARLFAFSVAVVGQTAAIQFLKLRLVRAELRQRGYAEMDPLTAISNRRGFDQALARAEESEERYALVLFDFDDFKTINDEHGHPTGDIVLRTVAHAAQTAVRRGDTLARIGGDEFAVIAPGAEQHGAERLVRALGAGIDAAAMPEGIGDVGVTFAWAVYPGDAADGDSLLSQADQRLLANKRAAKQPA